MHWRQREHKLAVPPEPESQIPTIDSEASVVLASNQIAHAVLAGKLDTKRARVVLACLKMAIDSLRRQQDVSDTSERDLTPAMHAELVAPRTSNVETGMNNVATKKNHVGTGALARAGGAPAPRSQAATEDLSSPGGCQSDEGSAVAPLTPFQQSATAFLADLTTSAPATIEDFEHIFDRHPLLTSV